MDFHALPHPAKVDARALASDTLAGIGMPQPIAMRHGSSRFAHGFSGEGYAGGYHSYFRSEVLDTDAFDAFTETADIFNPDMARRLREHIYFAGGRRQPVDADVAFRGRLQTPQALLRKRALLQIGAQA